MKKKKDKENNEGVNKKKFTKTKYRPKPRTMCNNLGAQKCKKKTD
jgi:hypothetical protein